MVLWYEGGAYCGCWWWVGRWVGGWVGGGGVVCVCVWVGVGVGGRAALGGESVCV